MTEEEWCGTEDPERQIEWLFYERRSDRKLRLFACSCCRSVAHFVTDAAFLQLLTDTEDFADGVGSVFELSHQATRLRQQFGMVLAGAPAYYPADAACEAILKAATIPYSFDPEHYDSEDDCPYPTWAATFARHSVGGENLNWPDCSEEEAETRQQLQYVRDIFSNPFRPVAFDPSWRSEAAVGIARGIYDDRAFERMPILADALQDAGCEDEQVLSHCREPGTHVRGCWVVDLVLGKE